MTAPINHNVLVGCMLPILKRTVSTQSTNLMMHDYFPEIYERFGVTRDEMPAIMPAVLTTDPLTGTRPLRYIGEDCSVPDDLPLKLTTPAFDKHN